MTGPSPTDLVEIHIVGIPLDIYREAGEHNDELLREFALIRERDSNESRSVPRRLLALMDELGQRFSGFTAEQEKALQTAAQGGESTLDLLYLVPAAAGQAALDLGILLDEADDFCRRGQALLTLATPPRALAFRRWFLEEFVRQVDGQAPRSWKEFEEAQD